MSFRVRPVRNEDFDAVYEMAKLTGGGFTNLPPDRGALVDKIVHSGKAFEAEANEPGEDLFMFVLENVDTGQIRGTCQVFGMVGTQHPFYSYRMGTLTQTSKALGKTFRAQLLNLSTDLEGSSEVGGLFLHPGERAGGLGLLLARSRYLFIKLHRARFAKRVIAELRGQVLRHELPGSGRIQRHARHAIHRRLDAENPDLHRDAARKRPPRHGRAAPFRSCRHADAGE
jgi:arginine N-succinyltransferase